MGGGVSQNFIGRECSFRLIFAPTRPKGELNYQKQAAKHRGAGGVGGQQGG